LKIQPEINAFHERFENEQYEAIYNAAAPAFQTKVQLGALEEYLGGIHKKAGACQPPGKPSSYFANSNTTGTTIRVQFRLLCSSGPLDEDMVFLVDKNVPKLLRYDASSPFVLK
jgi:hypothetical protein